MVKNKIIESLKRKFADSETSKELNEALDKFSTQIKDHKVNIKETFGFYNTLKDGSEGKIL